MVRPRESNPRPPALQSNALPTELILPWSNELIMKYGTLPMECDLYSRSISILKCNCKNCNFDKCRHDWWVLLLRVDALKTILVISKVGSNVLIKSMALE